LKSGTANLTKRSILSTAESIFDPLGLLGPVVKCKIFLQKLWQMKADWDTHVQGNIMEEWNEVYMHLPSLNEIHVDRKIVHSKSATENRTTRTF